MSEGQPDPMGGGAAAATAQVTTGQFTEELVGFIDREVSLGGETVQPSTDLVMTGLVDSLGVVMIVEWIEQRLDIEVDPVDVVIENFGSVGAMVDYVRGRSDANLG